jgi:catechol 2,3-dioxygenase-like lactoylglutathione lyase family enzyme
MLSDFTPMPTLATGNLDAAREFYEGTLGFRTAEDFNGGLMYEAGAGRFFLYESTHAGTNKATYMAFQVPADRFDSEVDALREKGVVFQTFEYPGVTWTEDVATMPAGEGTVQRAVWFADPDGNILNLETVV